MTFILSRLLLRPVLTVNRGRENTEEEIITSGAGGSEKNRN